MPINCSRYTESNPKGPGLLVRHPCVHEVVAKVSFLDNVGKPKQEYLCRRHLNALKKRVEGLKSRNGYDAQLTITEID